jgi:hypothetical protein
VASKETEDKSESARLSSDGSAVFVVLFSLVVALEKSCYQSVMKFLPSKETMATWEFVLTIVITLIIAAELGFAWAGFYEASDQYAVLKDLKTASQAQATTLKTLTDEQTKSLDSLKEMNGALQTSVRKTTDMAIAMQQQLKKTTDMAIAIQQQLKIIQEDQASRQAEAAKKPKLELQVGSVPVNTFFSIPIKAREETDTKSVFGVRLMNNGDAPARHGMLRVIVSGKDVSVQASAGFQKPYEEPDSVMHAILITFEVVRPHGNVGMDITLNYPKGQAPFSVIFNVDADEIATATSLGGMTVKPRKPSE